MKKYLLINFLVIIFGFTTYAQPGTIDLTFNPTDLGFEGDGADNSVYTTSIQSDGKIIIGGWLTTYNGIARNYIARLNTDGTLDTSFNSGTGASGAVYTTSIQSDGKIIIGGAFTSYNGIARSNIARLNADGTLDTSFNPGMGYNSSDVVRTTSIQSDGKIIIGGQFTTINGNARKNIARLNTNGLLDTSFNPGTGVNNFVYTTSIQSDGKIIIGGKFTSYNGILKNGIARLNTDGTLDTSFNPGTRGNSRVYTTSIQIDGKIIIGGQYITINDFAENNIARLNNDGTIDTSFVSAISVNEVWTTSIQSDGKIIIGGAFTTINSIAINRIVRMNTDGTHDIYFNPVTGSNSDVYTTSIQSDGKIIIGGDFTSYNGFARNRIARLNTDGTLDAAFNPGIGASKNVRATSIQSDGKIIIGGNFTTINGVARNGIARLNTDGTLDTTFNPGTGVYINQSISSVSIQSDGKIIIGDYYTSNSLTGYGIARLNTNGTLDTTFNLKGISSIATTSIQSDGKIIVGGGFTSFADIYSVGKNGIVRLNTNGLIDTSFNPGVKTGAGVGTGEPGTVYTTSIQSDGKVIIGGYFTSYNGIARNGIARLNTNGLIDTSFNPGVQTGAYGSVCTTSIQSDGKVIIGGNFTTINGIARNGIARLNTDGTLDTSFNPGTGIGVNSTFVVRTTSIQSDGKIIIGGNFTEYNGLGRNRITRINGNNALSTSVFNKNTITIYPNPTNGIYTLQTNEMNAVKSISIYTILGQKIHDAVISSNETTIDISNQPKGVYLYKVFGVEGETKSGKLVIE